MLGVPSTGLGQPPAPPREKAAPQPSPDPTSYPAWYPPAAAPNQAVAPGQGCGARPGKEMGFQSGLRRLFCLTSSPAWGRVEKLSQSDAQNPRVHPICSREMKAGALGSGWVLRWRKPGGG